MDDWYYVTYQFGSGGRLTGFGSIEMVLPGPPRRGGEDVAALARQITQISYERGTVPDGAGVVVTAWSRMGD